MPGRRFWKMSGSGNDFIFFDGMREAAGTLETPQRIGELCERRTGIGADGVVFLEPHDAYAFAMRYFNRDGSLAEMCGNAALCSARLASDLGIVTAEQFTFDTSSGPVTARFLKGLPEVDMVPVKEMMPDFRTPLDQGEQRIGYARVGVPHLLILADDVEAIDVEGRGRFLRRLSSLPSGANANFVSRDSSTSWKIRTYERGVETETLACGTGAVAAAALLTAWGLADGSLRLQTRSGRELVASVAGYSGRATPTLRGEGRIVFTGELGEL